ncbi:MAG: hypothetical protein A2Y02_03285 [Omnitrophica bacterium GWA2_52_12]|nr:MAG: hypothetical protein A2Y02_03285 [Omnitrophica bacterium GWA2_52_12]
MKTIYFENGKPVEGALPVAAWNIHGGASTPTRRYSQSAGSLMPPAGGIFETMRVYAGKIFCEKEHLARLTGSARISGLACALPKITEIQRQIRQAVKAYGKPEAVIRVTLTAGKILVMIGERKTRPELYREGIRLATTSVRRSLVHAAPPAAKSTDYMNAVLATLELPPQGVSAPAGGINKPAAWPYRRIGVDEWVFLDTDGYVTEVRTGNLFIVEKGGKKPRLKTPPLSGILDGVTRRIVIECALSKGLAVLEEPLTRHEIYNAAEVFLTNTSWEVLPVRELDGRIIGEALPGPITTQLHQLFKKRVLRECHK